MAYSAAMPNAEQPPFRINIICHTDAQRSRLAGALKAAQAESTRLNGHYRASITAEDAGAAVLIIAWPADMPAVCHMLGARGYPIVSVSRSCGAQCDTHGPEVEIDAWCSLPAGHDGDHGGWTD